MLVECKKGLFCCIFAAICNNDMIFTQLS